MEAGWYLGRLGKRPLMSLNVPHLTRNIDSIKLAEEKRGNDSGRNDRPAYRRRSFPPPPPSSESHSNATFSDAPKNQFRRVIKSYATQTGMITDALQDAPAAG